MIPYFFLETIPLGPITIQVWGLLVALGIVAGTLVSERFAKHQGISSDFFWDIAFWMLIGAFVSARLLFVVAYAPVYFFSHPFEVFALWQGGWSMMGGYLGAVVVAIFFFARKHLPFFATADAFIFGLPLGIGIGRLGCFLIHDHPGTPTHFFLGVLYPDGVARHDHGLYLSLIGFVVFLLFWIMKKYPRKGGDFVMTFLAIEGVSRFFLDFLRVTDVRYFGLAPAQYLGIIFFGLAVWLFAKRHHRPTL